MNHFLSDHARVNGGAHLVVEGEIPAEIAGRWYRSTPDPQYPPSYADDTYLSGDGMISMFRFERGHVDFKSRYVMTERLKNDRAARRSLYGRYRNPYTDHESVAHTAGRSAANTTPVFHAGRLLATKEDGRPVALDPDTLATLGEYDFGRDLRSQTFTAHVRIDADSGTMYAFGYEAGGLASRDVSYMVIDKNGALVSEQWFEAPVAAMMHDFAVTKTHAVFFFPVHTDLERLKAGGPHWVWNFEADTTVGIMPRDGSPADMRWFTGPPAMSFHFMNAFDEGGTVNVDFGVSSMVIFPFMQRDSGLEPSMGHSKRNGLCRWTFDLESQANTWHETVLAPPGDMPVVADRDHMKRYEIGYYMGFDPAYGPPLIAGPVGPGFNTLYRLNVNTGARQSYYAGPGTTLQEHVHIPSAQPGHEGWLLFIVDRHDKWLSEAHLLEAEHPDLGPVARIHLPFRLRNQVHGTWVPEADVAPRS